MKVILKAVLILAISWSTCILAEENPFNGLRNNLDSMLQAKDGQDELSVLKNLADERNTDIEVAFQNYLIAKKRVSIARAAFNPITTGQVLGMALGLNYLWAPIAIEAVLSIPTKLYNVSSNKYLAKAALYNSYEAKLALTNELAHLYYDILIHEVILKTIDQEIAIHLFLENKLSDFIDGASRISDNQAAILNLRIERLDIYNLYIEEVAALKILLTMQPSEKIDLAQISKAIRSEFLNNLDSSKLQDFALVTSNEYKTNSNLLLASQSNVKSVQWSILSFSGLNFSYSARVREAKVNSETANDQKISTSYKVKNTVLAKMKKLESSIIVFENYNNVYKDSIALAEDYNNLYSVGNASVDQVVETSISTIRDFRSKVVAHYAAWASLDDLSKAANFKFYYNNDTDNAQKELEKSPWYNISDKNFKVVKRKESADSITLAIQSDHNTSIAKVKYVFDDGSYPSQTSKNDTRDFYSTFAKSDTSEEHFSGKAIISFNNGYELEIKFKL